MKSKRRVWLGGAWVCLALIGLLFVVGPRHRSLGALAEERERLAARVVYADDGAAVIRRLETRLAETEAMAERQTRPIPQESDFASFMSALSERLDELQVREREINTGREMELEHAWSMPMSVTLRGPFLRVYSTIEWIESLPRLVRVQRLRIESERGRDTGAVTDSVRAELSLDLFFGADEETSQALAGASGEERR